MGNGVVGAGLGGNVGNGVVGADWGGSVGADWGGLVGNGVMGADWGGSVKAGCGAGVLYCLFKMDRFIRKILLDHTTHIHKSSGMK